MIRIALHAIGCRTNQAEIDQIRRDLGMARDEVQFVPWDEPADLYILNSCTVTSRADRSCRQKIYQAGRRAPGAPILVTGCYAQLAAGDLAALQGVTAVLDNRHKDQVARRALEALHQTGALPGSPDRVGDPASDAGIRARGLLKIQEGCDRRCAYCIVPLVRGPSRSVSLEQALVEASGLAGDGYEEIVVTGIHTGRWGHDLEPRRTLAGMLRRLLSEVPGPRFRISSLDPDEVTDGLLGLLNTESRLCRHLHLSLQHLDPDVLHRMHRPVSALSGTVERIAEKVPGIGLGADIIAGFPGETPEQFERLYDGLRALPLAYLHIFGFSPRPGTAAAEMEGLEPAIIRERVGRLRQLSEQTLQPRFLDGLVGRTLEVLVERADDGGLCGTSAEFATVCFDGPLELVGHRARPIVKKREGSRCLARLG